MYEGRGEFIWDAVGSWLAMFYNYNRGRHASKGISDFNPFKRKREVKLTHDEEAELLKAAFLNGKHD